MQEIIKEYGPALITVVTIIALIAIIVALLNANDGIVMTKFQELINSFFSNANSASGLNMGGTPTP